MEFVRQQRHVWEARHGAWVLRVIGEGWGPWSWDILGETTDGLARFLDSREACCATRQEAQEAVHAAWTALLMELGVAAEDVPTLERAIATRKSHGQYVEWPSGKGLV